ncbi:M23 family metallopeptidase [Glycomyces buryatensis]|uniref:M23 family metallopeptidase n=1 Tax=Glycomyces buryatensis TaxID=2570927 RepID=A0A4S8Q7C6_9ACTN|nr:M23 family metallopeptidase [Glycomyces buryatensis]THV38575.1 M23 family metallopeptidase [Glycomyces buryatensis]
MAKHDDTPEFSNRQLRSRRLRAVLRLRRIRNERHGWRYVTAGLVGIIAAGSVMSAVSGHSAASEAAEADSTEQVEFVQASWEVDSVIDEITAAQAAAAEAAAAEAAAAEAAAAEAAAAEAAAAEAAQKEAEEQAAAEAEAEAQRLAEEEAAAAEAARPDWISPSDSSITSTYGERWGRLHAGLDFGNNTGDDIWTIADGTVTYAGWMDGYGNFVVVDHGDGVTTAYGHATEVLVSVGDEVSQGDVVSLTGSTGNSTGPHLHFEVRIDDEQVDPMGWLEERGVEL